MLSLIPEYNSINSKLIENLKPFNNITCITLLNGLYESLISCDEEQYKLLVPQILNSIYDIITLLQTIDSIDIIICTKYRLDYIYSVLYTKYRIYIKEYAKKEHIKLLKYYPVIKPEVHTCDNCLKEGTNLIECECHVGWYCNSRCMKLHSKKPQSHSMKMERQKVYNSDDIKEYEICLYFAKKGCILECNIMGSWYEEETAYLNKNLNKSLYWYSMGFLKGDIYSFIYFTRLLLIMPYYSKYINSCIKLLEKVFIDVKSQQDNTLTLEIAYTLSVYYTHTDATQQIDPVPKGHIDKMFEYLSYLDKSKTISHVYKLASSYIFGIGTIVSYKKAFSLLHNIIIEYKSNLHAYNIHKTNKYIKECDDIYSLIALMYCNGWGCDKDINQAIYFDGLKKIYTSLTYYKHNKYCIVCKEHAKQNQYNMQSTKLLLCSGCHNVYYCCIDHQKMDWDKHKLVCLYKYQPKISYKAISDKPYSIYRENLSIDIKTEIDMIYKKAKKGDSNYMVYYAILRSHNINDLDYCIFDIHDAVCWLLKAIDYNNMYAYSILIELITKYKLCYLFDKIYEYILISANNSISAIILFHAMNIYDGYKGYYNKKEAIGWLLLLANIKIEPPSLELLKTNKLIDKKRYVSIVSIIKHIQYYDNIKYIDKAKIKLTELNLDWKDIDGRTPIYRSYQIV